MKNGGFVGIFMGFSSHEQAVRNGNGGLSVRSLGFHPGRSWQYHGSGVVSWDIVKR